MLILYFFNVSLAFHLSFGLKKLIVFDNDNKANNKLSSIIPTAGNPSVHT